MIPPPRPRCECCGVFVAFGWRRCHRCIDLPSPKQIAERAAEVRAGWSPTEAARRLVCPVQHVEAPVFPDDIFGPLVR